MAKRKMKDARLNSEARRDRRSDNREVTESRVLDDDPRLEEFRQSYFQSVLPDLPKIPGYHVCWLTTTNAADSIARRQRLGYEPIQASDIPGWESVSIKTGDYSGCIGVNEMVAFKLPIHLYEMYMREVHHEAPAREEERLRSVTDAVMEKAAEVARSGMRGIRVEVEEGNDELGRHRPPPVFSEASDT